jgi:hypothetical protein
MSRVGGGLWSGSAEIILTVAMYYPDEKATSWNGI